MANFGKIVDACLTRYTNETSSVMVKFECDQGEDIIKFYNVHPDHDIVSVGRNIFTKFMLCCGMQQIDDTEELIGKVILNTNWDEVVNLASQQLRLCMAIGMPKSKSDDRFIYVISCLDTIPELCKIGIARSPEVRLRQLSTGSPHPLQIEMTRRSPDARSIESAAHLHFSAKRRNGEWFEMPTIDAIDYVNDAVRDGMTH